MGDKDVSRSFMCASADKMVHHVTVCVTTNAGDADKTHFAIIHSRDGLKRKPKSQGGGISSALPNRDELAYLATGDAGFEVPWPITEDIERNSDIPVFVTSSGSQSQDTFGAWAVDLVRKLKKEGELSANKPRILYLDGHVSRWSWKALNHLRENHVHVLCIPSHSSIWAQPKYV